MQRFHAGERPVRMYSCFSYFMGSPITGGGAYSYRVQKNFHPTFNTFKSAKRCCHVSDTVSSPLQNDALNIWSSTQQATSTAMLKQQMCAIIELFTGDCLSFHLRGPRDVKHKELHLTLTVTVIFHCESSWRRKGEGRDKGSWKK